MQALADRGLYPTLESCAYLNQASLGLVPRPSTSAALAFLEDVAQHGNVRLSDAREAGVLDGLRSAGAAILGAPTSAMAVLGGASEGLGQLVALLASPDSEVVLVSSDFPSVTYPWLAARARLGSTIRWVEDRPDTDLTDDLLAAVTPATTAVCVSAVQYATGSRIDVGAVVEWAHRVGARVIVDVTQLAGAGEVDFLGWGVDALVSSGYKWLSAPGGVALMAVSEEIAQSVPHVVGWKGTDDPFDFDAQHLALANDARRFELSTMSYASAIALQESLSWLGELGMRRLADHAADLAGELAELVSPWGWRPFRPVGARGASSHIVSLRHEHLDAAEVRDFLDKEHGVNVSSRGGGLRVSLHGYNDSSDLERLLGALQAFAPS